MQKLRVFVLLPMVLYILATLGVYFWQDKLLYFPDTKTLSECDLPEGVEIWRAGAEQGLLSRNDNQNLMLFFHGNAGSACNWRYLGVNHLAAFGYDVLVVEYPGYGGDGQRPSKSGIEVTLEKTALWSVQEQYENISVMGDSLGSGAASIYAARYGAKAVFLFAPFDSVYNVAWGQGFLFPRFILTEGFDNIAMLADVDAPVMILHGLQDEVIAPRHSENLAQELLANGRQVHRETRAGIGHNGLFDNPEFDIYLQEMLGKE
ncbi:MAG: alpha/beta fold hydrolase [Paracoccaceae bacterium]